ncbi:hypothetical protein OSJ57_02995 [Sphingomonas sp. HH69]
MSLSISTRTMIGPSGVAQADNPSGPLDAILRELFRIAQRAGASRIHVETFDYEGRPTLSVLDNGSGIDSPRALKCDDGGAREDDHPPHVISEVHGTSANIDSMASCDIETGTQIYLVLDDGAAFRITCRCRTYSPQKCRMKIPQFEVSANPLRG